MTERDDDIQKEPKPEVPWSESAQVWEPPKTGHPSAGGPHPKRDTNESAEPDELSDDFDTLDGALLVQPAAADIDALFGTASAGMPLVDAVGPSDEAQNHQGPLPNLSRRGRVLLIVGAAAVVVIAVVTFLVLVRFD